MPMGSFGATFAPTPEAALNAPREASLAGVPQAIQVLSLALPRVLGQARLADLSLLTGRGGQGLDPASAQMLQTILRMTGAHGLPGGPVVTPGTRDDGGGAPPPLSGKPRFVTQDNAVPPGPRIPIRRGPMEA